MLIYACISSHGFGHGSRSAALLCELAALRPHWRLVLSTVLPKTFLDLSFAAVPYERRPCRWDVGVVQEDALGADPSATLGALRDLEEDLPGLIEQETAWLVAQRQPALILADVPPAAASLAGRLGLPLVWLANFGWDAIYGPMGGPFLDWAAACRRLYSRGDLLLRCPLSMAMPWGIPELAIGLTSSRPRLDAVALAERLQLPDDPERCVLISFGGLGLRIDPDLLGLWPDHVFIGPEPALSGAVNGRVLPPACRPLDLMPLARRLITKPGYSSFCEAFTQGVGIHLVRRRGFAEAPVLEEALQDHGRHRLLAEASFRRGEWELDQPLLEPRKGTLPVDGAAVAAAAVVELAESRSAVPIDGGKTV